MFYRRQFAGSFFYFREALDPVARMAEIAPRYCEVAQQHGNALGFWRKYCRPRIQQARVFGDA